MAVKEAACAKLSIPWRPNLGIQRVSNAKGSLAYKCFWHPQAPGSNVLGINWVAYPNTRGVTGSRTSWQLYLWRGHYGEHGFHEGCNFNTGR